MKKQHIPFTSRVKNIDLPLLKKQVAGLIALKTTNKKETRVMDGVINFLENIIDNTVKESDQIEIIWSIEDVVERAKEQGFRVNKSRAREILSTMEDQHDCNYGITWNDIDAHL